MGTAQAPDILTTDISAMFDTNVTGLINMTQAILPIFKKRPDGGAGDIINIGSIAGGEGYPGGSVYCASKAAIRIFSEAMRKELMSTRIRVVVIDPGQVESVITSKHYYPVLANPYSRNSHLSDLEEIKRGQTRSMRMLSRLIKREYTDTLY
jgi:3-hydroxy acid dehydrogenase/malonic semialdehyde reductase